MTDSFETMPVTENFRQAFFSRKELGHEMAYHRNNYLN
jgi:hypothetical protein